MHPLGGLSQTTQNAIRAQVLRVLKEYASGGRHDSIDLTDVFTKVIRNLGDIGVITRRPGYSTITTFDRSHNSEVPIEISDYIRQLFWELYNQGILAPSPYYQTHGSTKIFNFLGLDRCMITQYGIQVLIDSSNRIQVHDPSSYLENFHSASPGPDYEMMRYLAECVEVFRHGHLLATVILLGAASERLVDVFAEKLRDALLSNNDGANWYSSSYQNKREISKKFDAVTGKLGSEYPGALDSRDLSTIRLSFEAIRTVRNDIVHSHSYQPTNNEVGGLMHNFVLYFKLIHKVFQHLHDNPK